MAYQLWPEWSEIVLPSLRMQMTGSTFDAVLSCSELYKNGDETIIIKAKSQLAAEWLGGRLSEVVKRSLISFGGLPDSITMQFTYEGGGLLDTPTGDDQPGDDQPIWDTKAQVLWCLNHKEASGQYFRYYWRPLLGPLLSELVRELRQIAYKKNSQSQKVEIKVTHKTLGEMLGVHPDTIQHALLRPKNGAGVFYRNKYLHLFIPYSKTVQEYNEQKYRKVNAGTIFRVVMNDPILPEHQELI